MLETMLLFHPGFGPTPLPLLQKRRSSEDEQKKIHWFCERGANKQTKNFLPFTKQALIILHTDYNMASFHHRLFSSFSIFFMFCNFFFPLFFNFSLVLFLLLPLQSGIRLAPCACSCPQFTLVHLFIICRAPSSFPLWFGVMGKRNAEILAAAYLRNNNTKAHSATTTNTQNVEWVCQLWST